MKLYHRKAILSFGFLAVTSISLIVLLASSVLTLAAPPGTVGPQDRTHLTKGPVAWPVKKSQPLHQPINAPKSPKGRRLHQPTNPSKSGGYAVTASAVPSVCTPTTIDLKVLVLAADGNE